MDNTSLCLPPSVHLDSTQTTQTNAGPTGPLAPHRSSPGTQAPWYTQTIWVLAGPHFYQYNNIFGSRSDWNHPSTIADITQFTQLYIFTPNNWPQISETGTAHV